MRSTAGISRSLGRLLCGLLLVLGPVLAVPAQEAPRVHRDRVVPHWFAGNRQFWYRNDLPDQQREFIRVDATTGDRKPAFDHARVAAALSKLLEKEISAERLPVESLQFAEDGASVVLTGRGARWTLDLQSYEIQSVSQAATVEDSLPVSREVRPSRDGGADSNITFINRLEQDVELFWVTAEGDERSYGKLKPGATKSQHTFAGHVWHVVKLPEKETVAVFEAADEAGDAIIDGRQPDPPRRRRGRRGGNRANVNTTVDRPWQVVVRNHNLILRKADGEQEVPLTTDATATDTFVDTTAPLADGDPRAKSDTPPIVYWSPDSRRFVALQTHTVTERQIPLIESSPRDQVQPRLIQIDYAKPGDELPQRIPRLFDVESQREIPVNPEAFANSWSLDSFRWASDSSRITCVFNQRGHQVLRVLSINATDGAVQTLVDEHSDTFIHYSAKFYLEWLGDDELIWMSERDGWNHLWLYDARTGQVKHQITQGEWNVREVVRLDPESREIWFHAVGIPADQDPYHLQLCRIKLDGTEFTRLTDGDGTHTVQWSPDREFLLDTWSRVDLPPVTALRRGSNGTLVCPLEEADASQIIAARGSLPERFTAIGRDGTTPIWGIIHRPRDFDPAKTYPVIENIYAGPHGQHVPKAFRSDYRTQQAIADRGFIVVQIDGMGTAWRSKKFHDVCWQNLRDAGFPDRIAWMKAAATKYPQLDLTRVGIYGGSAGGQNALAALLWHGDFYHVAVADCGCHDNRMDKIWWNEQWMGWPIGPQYEDSSNVAHAHQLQGKLMLVVGELDRNVDPASTMQVASALVRANKEFDLLIVPGAGHGACEIPWASRRRTEFFVRHLLK